MFQIKGGRSRSLTLSQQRTMTLGGPIFSRMTNEIDQDGISLSAGPDCNRRWPPPPPPLRRPRGATRARGREKDHRGGVVGREGRGSGENKFRISCRIGRPRRGGASGAATDRYSTNSCVGIFLAIDQNYRGRMEGKGKGDL